jgi:hypothetical protein
MNGFRFSIKQHQLPAVTPSNQQHLAGSSSKETRQCQFNDHQANKQQQRGSGSRSSVSCNRVAELDSVISSSCSSSSKNFSSNVLTALSSVTAAVMLKYYSFL